MLNSADLITLRYTPDLTEAGIVYACRSLPFTYNRMGGSAFNRLRRIVAGKAVELAFRRYLANQAVPFDNLGATPFTDPDRYDIALGGRRCDIKSFQFLQKERIRRLRKDPGYLLQADALVPADQMASSQMSDNDLYIFAFLTALVTSQPGDLERALAAGQPAFLIYPFPPAWAHPHTWRSLGRLVLSSRAAQPASLELGGQGPDRSFCTERLNLPGQQPAPALQEYYSLAYLHTALPPDGPLNVYSPTLKQTHRIYPEKWGNIWVYGMEVILAGYMARGEFRRRGQRLPAGSRVLQYDRTRTPNLALPIKDLHPLSDLLARTRTWSNNVKRGTFHV